MHGEYERCLWKEREEARFVITRASDVRALPVPGVKSPLEGVTGPRAEIGDRFHDLACHGLDLASVRRGKKARGERIEVAIEDGKSGPGRKPLLRISL
jgi:hypothetical protein